MPPSASSEQGGEGIYSVGMLRLVMVLGVSSGIPGTEEGYNSPDFVVEFLPYTSRTRSDCTAAFLAHCHRRPM